MDPIKNPFSPGAGSPPPELVGRNPILEQGRILLGRVKLGRSEQSMLLIGLRGVGKTVLLNEIERMASSTGYNTIMVEAHENTTLGVLLAPSLRTALFKLDRLAAAGDKVKRGMAVLRSFIGTLKVEADGVRFGLDIEPETGSADSGDIEIDLPNVFVAVAEAAKERSSAVAIFVDELQYLNHKELGSLIMAMHRVQQLQLPLVLLGAGLPILPGLAGDSKSYAERLFSFPEIGPLTEPDARKALSDPAMQSGVKFQDDALSEVYRLTKGYPYFLQELGYQSWNVASSSPITLETVQRAVIKVIPRLDQNFFRVRFDRLTLGEKNFLRAMAQLGRGPYRTADLVKIMKLKKNTSLGPLRASLIKKGMIYSPSHGDLDFTVPLFDEFMRRAIPEFTS